MNVNLLFIYLIYQIIIYIVISKNVQNIQNFQSRQNQNFEKTFKIFDQNFQKSNEKKFFFFRCDHVRKRHLFIFVLNDQKSNIELKIDFNFEKT